MWLKHKKYKFSISEYIYLGLSSFFSIKTKLTLPRRKQCLTGRHHTISMSTDNTYGFLTLTNHSLRKHFTTTTEWFKKDWCPTIFQEIKINSKINPFFLLQCHYWRSCHNYLRKIHDKIWQWFPVPVWAPETLTTSTSVSWNGSNVICNISPHSEQEITRTNTNWYS